MKNKKKKLKKILDYIYCLLFILNCLIIFIISYIYNKEKRLIRNFKPNKINDDYISD
jgi:hypothetical protein